jgi:CheY-like chemotaxis protein
MIPAPAPKPSWSPAPARVLPASILVAEDNRVNQMVIMSQLRRLGYAADLAVDGKEAVAQALRKRYDLILMDCQMPRMDGFAAAEAILAAPRDFPPPVILALTGGLMLEERICCQCSGMAGVLEKPLRLPDLREALLSVFPRNVEATPSPEPLPG